MGLFTPRSSGDGLSQAVKIPSLGWSSPRGDPKKLYFSASDLGLENF